MTLDSRVRAGVGYVPYFGLDSLPAFGRDQAGAQGVTLPFFALSGTRDSIAPPKIVREALDKMEGPRGHVLFNGQGHDLDPGSGADIVTWSLGFLAAWVNGDAAAKSQADAGRERRRRARRPQGALRRPDAAAARAGEVVDTIEYYNASLDHYFITAFPEEAADLDAGGQVQGWTRTGYSFQELEGGHGSRQRRVPVLRHAGRRAEFALLHDQRGGVREGEGESGLDLRGARVPRGRAARRPAAPPSTQTVTRLYNNGMGGEANHRYLTDAAEIDRTVAKGWLVEGPVFCVPR